MPCIVSFWNQLTIAIVLVNNLGDSLLDDDHYDNYDGDEGHFKKYVTPIGGVEVFYVSCLLHRKKVWIRNVAGKRSSRVIVR